MFRELTQRCVIPIFELDLFSVCRTLAQHYANNKTYDFEFVHTNRQKEQNVQEGMIIVSPKC